MKKLLKRVQAEGWSAEIVIAASILIAFGMFLFLGAAGGFTSGNLGAWLHYYAYMFSGSLPEFVYVTILFFCLLIILLVIWSLGRGFLGEFFAKLSTKKDPRQIFSATLRRAVPMLLIIPAVLFITIVALAMGEANEFARARLADGMVIGWEHALFGAYAFAALGAIRYPAWLIDFIIFSFDNMALILVVAGMVVAYLAPRRFRELLIAFCIGILAMVPFWLMVPVLSPQDRYIDNIYQLPMPPAIAAAVANYHPQPQIAAFLDDARKEKAGLPALPTSTFPSAHVFWAAIAGYYLFRARRWLGWIVLPLLVASTFGTILLAQHYFFDVPLGLAIAALAIWLAHDFEIISQAAVSRGTPDAPPSAAYR